jgi:hypothetical protein
MYSSPLPCYLIPLGPKYPPQHFILENTQPLILSICDCTLLIFYIYLFHFRLFHFHL